MLAMTRRRRTLTRDDVAARRHDLYRDLHARGWSLETIAAVCRSSKSAVHRTLDRDRQIREAIEDAPIP